MRHRKLSKKLNRDTSLRQATVRGIVSGLILHERVRTTLTKAKVSRGLAEKLITFGKRADMGSQNKAMQILSNKILVQKLFKEIAPLFKNRIGGYTRIILDKTRPGDGAMMAFLEFTEKKEVIVETKGKARKKADKGKHEEEPASKEGSAAPKDESGKEAKDTHHPKKDEAKDILKEEIAKEKAKSETKQLDKGLFKGFKRYFRSNPRKGNT